MEAIKGMCMKERKEREMKDSKLVRKNNRCFIMGKCKECGTKMSRIIKCPVK